MTIDLITTNDIIKATITITGNALDLINDFKKVRNKDACTIRLETRIKYQNKRHTEWYGVPAVQDGNIEKAMEAIQKLFQQRAISGEQFDSIEHVILEAETVTKPKHF
jgi:hypothetical protein